MDHIASVNKEVEEVALKAEEYLQQIDPSPFSAAAFSILKGKIGQYVKDLIHESIKISIRDRADNISTKHVELASERLTVHPRNRLYKHLGTVGGILLGAALSNILTMQASNQFSFQSVLTTVILGIVGAFLIAFNIAVD